MILQETSLITGFKQMKNGCFVTIKMFDWLAMGFLKNENECVDKHGMLETTNDCLYGKTTIQFE